MAKDIIRKAKNGTYFFRAHLGFDSNGKRIQKYQSGFKTKREARDSYYELLLHKSDFLESKDEEIKFDVFIKSIFLPWYRSQVQPQTYENRLTMITKHFSYFDNFYISRIQPLDVHKWQLNLLETLKPSYVRAVQGLFSLAMNRAVTLRIIEENPSKVIGNVKKQKSKVQFWTKDEFEKSLAVIDKNDYYQHFLYVTIWFLFMSGLRIGEATALYWDYVNLESGVLEISKSLIYKNKKDYRFSSTKTKKSYRNIVLDNDTLTLLKTWKKRQYNINPDEPFILSYNGYPTQRSTLSYVMKRLSKRAGTPPIRTHDLRHSHVALLIALGENPLIIRDRLGHKDIETTLGTYGHLYPNTNYEVASKLNGLITVHENSTKITLTKNQFTSRLT